MWMRTAHRCAPAVQKGTAIDAPVAKIGDVEYASLSKAINAVQNGGTITLLDDLDLDNGAVLQVGSSQKNFTIDLDNHTLSADGACLIMLHNGSHARAIMVFFTSPPIAARS